MYFVPACRNIAFLALACTFSFLTAVVNHNTMHQGMFHSRTANRAFQLLLSFAALYPVSSNVPAHNLVHHHFEDDGAPDWAAPGIVRFKWNLLNLVHFPNVCGPITFAGVTDWAKLRGKGSFRQQHALESAFAFGLTGLLLWHDFWAALFFVMVPQLWGARWFLRINIIQHDGCDTTSEWDHSRNFVSPFFNWFMLNNGYHTIHHNRAGLHWTELARTHKAMAEPRMDPRLNEPSFLGYLFRAYVLTPGREEVESPSRAVSRATEIAALDAAGDAS